MDVLMEFNTSTFVTKQTRADTIRQNNPIQWKAPNTPASQISFLLFFDIENKEDIVALLDKVLDLLFVCRSSQCISHETHDESHVVTD